MYIIHNYKRNLLNHIKNGKHQNSRTNDCITNQGDTEDEEDFYKDKNRPTNNSWILLMPMIPLYKYVRVFIIYNWEEGSGSPPYVDLM